MQRKHLRFGKGFRVALGNARVLGRDANRAEPGNRHRGADQWLYVVSGTGSALVNGQRYALRPGTLLLIERQDTHEVKNTGRDLLRTLNVYVPPAYTAGGDERPAAKP